MILAIDVDYRKSSASAAAVAFSSFTAEAPTAVYRPLLPDAADRICREDR